ncbi:MAG: molybdopterin converting factor subunit 1 [Sphingomonadales bacterium]
MKILYFAWLRSKTGVAGETVALPKTVKDVAALKNWLKERGPGFAEAFADDRTVRAAVNQNFAQPDHPVADGDEVAFFPPITGGAR